MLSLVGLLFTSVSSVASSFFSTQRVQIQADSDKAIAGMQASNTLTLGFAHDIGVEISRDLIMFPGSAWCGLYIWDKIMARPHPELVWVVSPLDGPMQYLPFVLLSFFFGMAAIRFFK